MSKTMQWIGRNLSLGGIVRNAGSGLGKVSKYTAQGAGAAASLLTDNPETKRRIKNACASAGGSMDAVITKSSSAAGQGINYGVQKLSEGVGHASGATAKLMGASEDNVLLAKKVGTVAGAVVVGVVAGVGVADAAVALGAAAGTAGGAATTSGLAALGGGSIAAGGGGMAAGQAVAQSIVAAGGVSGAASLKKDDVV